MTSIVPIPMYIKISAFTSECSLEHKRMRWSGRYRTYPSFPGKLVWCGAGGTLRLPDVYTHTSTECLDDLKVRMKRESWVSAYLRLRMAALLQALRLIECRKVADLRRMPLPIPACQRKSPRANGGCLLSTWSGRL